jgi:hypothetical protein
MTKSTKPKAGWLKAFPEQAAALRPERAKRAPGNPVTRTRKQRSDALYREIAEEFLALPENRWCRVEMALIGERIEATAIHHIRGRFSTLKYDNRFFCPVNTRNALWPHEHIEEARRLNLIAAVGDWKMPPKDAETDRIYRLMQEKGIV